MGPGTQALFRYGPLQQVLGLSPQITILADFARAHLCIGVDALRPLSKAVQLDLARPKNPLADVR